MADKPNDPKAAEPKANPPANPPTQPVATPPPATKPTPAPPSAPPAVPPAPIAPAPAVASPPVQPPAPPPPPPTPTATGPAQRPSATDTPKPPPAPTHVPVAAQGAGLDVLANAPDEPRPGYGHPATPAAPANLPAFVQDKPGDSPKPKVVDTGARPGIELPPPPLSEMVPTATNAPPPLLGGRPRVPTPPPITPGPGEHGYDDHLARVARETAAQYEEVGNTIPPVGRSGVPGKAAAAHHDRHAASKLRGVTPGPLHTGDAKFGRVEVTGHPGKDQAVTTGGRIFDAESAESEVPHTAVNDDPNIAHVVASRILGATPQAAKDECHSRWLTYREAGPGEPVPTGPDEDRPATQEEAKAGVAHPHDKATVMATRQEEKRRDRVNVTIGPDGLVSSAWVG